MQNRAIPAVTESQKSHAGRHFRRSSAFVKLLPVAQNTSEAHLAMALGNCLSVVLLEQGMDQMGSRDPRELQLFCHSVVISSELM